MNACNNNNIKPEEITVDDETKIDNIYIYIHTIYLNIITKKKYKLNKNKMIKKHVKQNVWQ